MSMTITEGNAVNVLLDYIAGTPNHLGEHPSAERVSQAAMVLAQGAHKVLMAGWVPDSALVAVYRAASEREAG